MIVLVCIAVGAILRVLTGRSFRDLATVRLRGETLLLILLASQAALPLVQLTGVAGRIAFFVWLATFPCMVGIAWLNRSEPGMPVLGVGLLLNLAVIAVNEGMPVFEVALQTAKSLMPTLAIPAGDFVHVVGSSSTFLPWLGDVVPIAGPSWLRVVVSPGDLLLFAGIITLVATLGSSRARESRRGQ